MVNQIEIDDDVWSLLRAEAEPFVDTPNSVLRRLLHLNVESSSDPRQLARTAGERSKASPRSKKAKVKRADQKKPGGRTRAPAGSLLPEGRYELPLLRALDEAGGSAPYREVVDAVGRQLKDQFMPLDLETLTSGGIRWQSRLQFVRLRLIERGYLDRDTPRGIWGITPAGKAALEGGEIK
jgi:Mrr N-terminal domain